MSETRKINAPLALVVNLGVNAPQRYLKAFIWDTNGTIGDVDLISLGSGVYVDNTYIMPNKFLVVAQFVVYHDIARTIVDDAYEPASQGYNLDTFDLSLIQPVNAAVFGIIEEEKIVASVSQEEAVFAEIEIENIESEVSEEQRVNGIIEQNEDIEGVVNE